MRHKKLKESALQKTLRLIFGSFAQVKGSIWEGSRFFYFAMSLTAVQLNLLPMMVNERSGAVSDKERPIRSLIKYFSPGMTGFETEQSFLAIFVSYLVLITSTLGLLGLCMYRESRGMVLQSKVRALTGILLRSQGTFLLLPMCSVLIRAIQGDVEKGKEGGLFSKGTSSHMAIIVISCICFAAMLLTTSFHTLNVFHNLPYDKSGKNQNLWSLAHGRVELVSLVVRTTLVVAFMSGSDSFSFFRLHILAGLSVAAGLLLSGLYVYYLPYFNQMWNTFLACAYSVCLLSGLSFFVTIRLGASDDYSGIVLFIGSFPFIVGTTLAAIYNRTKSLKAQKNIFETSAYLAEVQLRLKHQDTVKHRHSFAFKADAETEYMSALEALPGSAFLHLYVACLVTTCSNRIILSLNLIRKAKETQLPLDLEFYLFDLHWKQEKLQKSGDSTVNTSFLDLDEEMAETKDAVFSTLRETARFWEVLSKDSFSLQDLLKVGAQVHELMDTCQARLAKLQKLARSNKEVNYLVAVYTWYILNDRRTAVNIRSRTANQTEESSEQRALCQISGDISNLGEILKVSDGLLSLLGYSKTDLIGRNVSMLCPPPFDRVHDMFLQQFVSTDSEFETTKRRVFGLHSKGHIIPLNLEVTPSINAESELLISARFAKVKQWEDGESHLLLVDRKTGLVTATTEDAPYVLDIDENDIFALNTKIFDLFECTMEEEGKLVFPREIIQSKTTGMLFSVKVKDFHYRNKRKSVVNFDMGIVLVTITMTKETDMYLQTSLNLNSSSNSLENISCSHTSDPRPAHSMRAGTSSDTCSQRTSAASTNVNSADGECPFSSRPLFNVSGLNHGTEKVQDGICSFRPQSVSPITVSPREGSQSESDGCVGEPFRQLQDKTTRKTLESMESGSTHHVVHEMGNNVNGSYKLGRSVRIGARLQSPGSVASAARSTRKKRGFDESSHASASVFGDSEQADKIANIHARIQKNLTKKDPNLVKFGKLGLRFLFLYAMLTVVSVLVSAWCNFTMQEHADSLATVFSHVHHVSMIANIVLFSQWNPVMQVGSESIPRAFLEESESISLLEERVDLLLDAHHDVAKMLESGLDKERLHNMFYQPSVDIFSGRSSSQTSVNLAVREIVHSAENIISKNLQRECDSNCDFIITNSMVSLKRKMAEMKDMGFSLAKENFDAKWIVQQVTLACIALLLLVSFALIYGPMFVRNTSSKQQVGDAFGAIPRSVCESLKKKTSKRLSNLLHSTPGQLCSQIEEEDDEMMMTLNEEFGQDGLFALALKAREEDQSSQQPLIGRQDKQSRLTLRRILSTRVTPDTISTKRERHTLYAKTLTLNFLRQVLQAASSFWFAVAFLLIIRNLESTSLNASKYMTASLMVVGNTLNYAGDSLFWAAAPATSTWWEQQGVGSSLDLLQEFLTSLDSFNAALKFGNESLDALAFTDTSGPLFNVYFENSCGASCTEFLSTASSSESMSNANLKSLEALQHGLIFGLDVYRRKIHAIQEAGETFLGNRSAETLEILQKAQLQVKDLKPELLVLEELHTVMRLHLNAMHELHSASLTRGAVVCVVLLLSLMLSHYLSVRAFNEMDRDLKKTQVLLLMLPVEIFNHVPEMSKLVHSSSS